MFEATKSTYWDVGVNKIVKALTTAKQEKDKVVQ